VLFTYFHTYLCEIKELVKFIVSENKSGLNSVTCSMQLCWIKILIEFCSFRYSISLLLQNCGYFYFVIFCKY